MGGGCFPSQEVVWWAQSSPAACPLQRAKGSIRAAQRTVESAVWDAQREEPEGLEEKISLIFFFIFHTLNVPQ